MQFRIWSIEDKLIYGGVEFLREIYFDWIHCAQQFVLICSDCEGSHHWRVQDLVNGQCWYMLAWPIDHTCCAIFLCEHLIGYDYILALFLYSNVSLVNSGMLGQ